MRKDQPTRRPDGACAGVAGQRDSAVPEERHPQLVEDPAELPPGVPDQVRTVLHGALERVPENRPLPTEIAQALEPVLAALPAPRLTWKVGSRL
jgi:hypothetical protein